MARRRTLAAFTFIGLIGLIGLVLTGCGGSSDPRATWHGAARQPGVGEGPAGDESSLGLAASGATAKPTPSTSTSGAPTSPGASPAPSTSPAAPTKGIKLSQLTTGNTTVALTFDDGPSEFTPKLLDLLRENGVKATFCLIGVNVRDHPDLVRQIVEQGHTLCNHSWKHDLKLGDKTPDQIRADLQATNDEIHKAVPDAQIKYFRNPGGNFTANSVAVAKELGMASIGWNVDPTDWNTEKYTDGTKMTSHILATVRKHTKAGSIVLSHDGGGDRKCTMSAYKTLLPELKSKFTLAALPV
jgi:peptidoglycan/xylan/chitin deacetylase (PgdA/CDA1 family)